jgi:hypothetical protein
MGLISYTNIAKKTSAILNDDHVSHTIFITRTVCDTNYPMRLTTRQSFALK